MGDWLYGYDTRNRLTGSQNALATGIASQYAGQYGCWNYDPFGNRTQESNSTAASASCAGWDCYAAIMAECSQLWIAEIKRRY